MAGQDDNISKKLSTKKIILPIIIGFAVIIFMLYREFWSDTPQAVKARESLALITFAWQLFIWLFFAFVMMALRDIFYMLRIRILTDKELNWKQCFRVIMLWEFASAITPAAIGGTSVSVLFVHKEGISVGRSTAVVLAVSILDELYFLIMFPLLFLLLGGTDLFVTAGQAAGGESVTFANKYFYFAFVGYCIKFVFGVLVIYGLFFKPKALKSILEFVFKFPYLRKWKEGASKAGDDLIASSAELKSRPFSFWAKAFMASFFSWTARYFVLNFLLIALLCGATGYSTFNLYDIGEHIVIFARQLMMWIMLLVMPSPGGSGFAEAVFSDYMAEFVPLGFVIIMAFFWRFVSYYPYLLIGAIVVPRWLKRNWGKKKDDSIV